MTATEAAQRTGTGLRSLFEWVAFDARVEVIEWWSATNALVWGLWIFNPYVDVFSTVPGFATMAIIPEWVWGLYAIVASSVQLYGRRKHDLRLERYGSRGLVVLWLFVAGCLIYQNWRWPATVLYPMLALASFLVSYRASGPRRAA